MHPVHPAVVRAKTSRAWPSAGNRYMASCAPCTTPSGAG